MTTLAEALGSYCAQLEFDALPRDVVDMAKVKILDTLACAFAALDTETTEVIDRYQATCAPTGPVALWGLGRGSTALDAAFGNALMAHALLHDDTDLESGHVASMVVPALLAAAGDLHYKDGPVDGRDILAAIVVGYEVMWRGSACGAVVKGSLERSFRGYVINGALGAAAATGRVLRLDAAGHAAAISCAANAVSGLLEPVGVASIERSVMAGNNSRTGLHAALLAQCGLSGTPAILEGAQGYFQAVGGDAGLATSASLEGLGERHRILETLYKMYPSAGANQSAIYAAEIAYQRHRPDTDSISSVHVIQYPLFGRAVRMSNGEPAYPSIISSGPYTNVEETLPNKPFGVAAMLLFGSHDFRAIENGLNNLELRRLAEKVSSDGSDSFGPLDAAIEIVMMDGRRIEERVDCGDDPRFFPTMITIADRLQTMCGRYLDSAMIDRLVATVDCLEQDGGIGRFFDLIEAIGNCRQPKNGGNGK